jgi:hypothetical protein
MNIKKDGTTAAIQPLEEDDLALINALARRPLKAEEVYTFGVCLCDNEVDRDCEKFDLEALNTLAKLFVGKTGIFDHQWQAQGQTARIYRTELVTDDSLVTASGEPYTALKGYAYMVRTEGNEDLIREIEGGIKKEVSVSCAVRDTVCSICGNPIGDREHCQHTKGRWYQEGLCYGILKEPTDAYEWSFVAVPAQPRAGVVKNFAPKEPGVPQGGATGMTWKEYLAPQPELLRQVEELERESQLGRRYLSALRKEVARLGGLVQPGLASALREKLVAGLGEEELLALKKSYEAQLERDYPPVPQLRSKGVPSPQPASDDPFLI